MERLGEWNHRKAQENQKGSHKEPGNISKHSSVVTNHLAWIVTFPSKREMMPRGRDRAEKGHSPKLRTGKAGMAVNHGAVSMWDSRWLEIVLLSDYMPYRAQCRQVSSHGKWEQDWEEKGG